MKILLLAAFLAALSIWMAVPGCAHAPTATDGAKNCAVGALQKTVANISGDIAAVLECNPVDATPLPACLLIGLENIGKRWGVDALNCAVDIYVTPSSMKAALTPLQVVGRTRAQTWKASRDRGLGDGPSTAASGPRC
jgi:hypothetical protein